MSVALNWHTQELINQERRSMEIVEELNEINSKIARLKLQKESLEQELIETIGHDYEGSRTYELFDKAVTIKTGMIYSLDKRQFENIRDSLPDEWNPVREKISYDIDKRKFDECEQSAPREIRCALSAIVTKKPAKPNVKIKERV